MLFCVPGTVVYSVWNPSEWFWSYQTRGPCWTEAPDHHAEPPRRPCLQLEPWSWPKKVCVCVFVVLPGASKPLCYCIVIASIGVYYCLPAVFICTCLPCQQKGLFLDHTTDTCEWFWRVHIQLWERRDQLLSDPLSTGRTSAKWVTATWPNTLALLDLKPPQTTRNHIHSILSIATKLLSKVMFLTTQSFEIIFRSTQYSCLVSELNL